MNGRARVFALVGAAAALGSGSLAAPAAVAAAPHDVPAVQSVSLESSQAKVTSSTGRALRASVTDTQSGGQVQGQPGSGFVTVTLRTGTSINSELHVWTFPAASAMTVDSTGNGSLNVPSSNLSPYGTINLKITPIGDPTTQNCQGTPTSQTQNVSLVGTFFFDTRSKGTNKWGTVGKKTGKFTFSSTNTVTTTYVNTTNPGACINYTIPCAAGVFWSSNSGALAMEGISAGTKGSIFGSRSTSLTTPSGATRSDEAFGKSKKLVLVRNGNAASLSVKADTNGAGSATLSASKHGKANSVDCKDSNGKSHVETSTVWNNAKYKNGSTPLKVKAQIFGAIKVADNNQAEISTSTIS